MTNSELVAKYAEVVGISKNEAKVRVVDILQVIFDGVVETGEVALGVLGKIVSVERAEKECLVNPKQPELGKKICPAYKAPKFKASKGLKEAVK